MWNISIFRRAFTTIFIIEKNMKIVEEMVRKKKKKKNNFFLYVLPLLLNFILHKPRYIYYNHCTHFIRYIVHIMFDKNYWSFEYLIKISCSFSILSVLFFFYRKSCFTYLTYRLRGDFLLRILVGKLKRLLFYFPWGFLNNWGGGEIRKNENIVSRQ